MESSEKCEIPYCTYIDPDLAEDQLFSTCGDPELCHYVIYGKNQIAKTITIIVFSLLAAFLCYWRCYGLRCLKKAEDEKKKAEEAAAAQKAAEPVVVVPDPAEPSDHSTTTEDSNESGRLDWMASDDFRRA